jgi:hypothetical protein
MTWADQHGVGYLAWGWWVLSQQEINDAGCSAYYLISDPSGTPAAPNGVNLHDHLATLGAGGATPTTPTPTTTTPTTGTTPGTTTPAPALRGYGAHVKADGSAISFIVRADQNSTGVITARTVGAFAVSAVKRQRRRVPLGSVSFRLTAGTSRIVSIRLSRSSRNLLSRQRKLKAQITITLTNSANQRSVSQRTLTLKAPARH